jgi:hypothetical protein
MIDQPARHVFSLSLELICPQVGVCTANGIERKELRRYHSAYEVYVALHLRRSADTSRPREPQSTHKYRYDCTKDNYVSVGWCREPRTPTRCGCVWRKFRVAYRLNFVLSTALCPCQLSCSRTMQKHPWLDMGMLPQGLGRLACTKECRAAGLWSTAPT